MMEDYSISHGFSDPLRWWPVERQNTFTDAVFSIAATIAVANLGMEVDFDMVMITDVLPFSDLL